MVHLNESVEGLSSFGLSAKISTGDISNIEDYWLRELIRDLMETKINSYEHIVFQKENTRPEKVLIFFSILCLRSGQCHY